MKRDHVAGLQVDGVGYPVDTPSDLLDLFVAEDQLRTVEAQSATADGEEVIA
jgi:hypothetical protein